MAPTPVGGARDRIRPQLLDPVGDHIPLLLQVEESVSDVVMSTASGLTSREGRALM